MALPARQLLKVRQWLAAKFIEMRRCSSCGQFGELAVSDMLASNVTDEIGNLISDRGVYFIPVACPHCGHTRLFSATMIGVAPP